MVELRASVILAIGLVVVGCGKVREDDPDAMVVTCDPGETDCDGVCADLDTSSQHCGDCDTACGPDQSCVGGSCELACSGATPDECSGVCTNTQSDPANCGACATAGGAMCNALEDCLSGACVRRACDDFAFGDSTTVPGWTEQTGDFFIDQARLMTTAMANVYRNHITMDGTTELDGCATANLTYGVGMAVKAVGIVLRWTGPDSYVVALVQDNTTTGNFNSMWIYEYPGETQLANLSNVVLGTTPAIRAEVVGTQVTLQVDVERDGIYDQTLTGTTTRIMPGPVGFMGLSFGMPAFAEDFCWGC